MIIPLCWRQTMDQWLIISVFLRQDAPGRGSTSPAALLHQATITGLHLGANILSESIRNTTTSSLLPNHKFWSRRVQALVPFTTNTVIYFPTDVKATLTSLPGPQLRSLNSHL